jgi:hypothetical protein
MVTGACVIPAAVVMAALLSAWAPSAAAWGRQTTEGTCRGSWSTPEHCDSEGQLDGAAFDRSSCGYGQSLREPSRTPRWTINTGSRNTWPPLHPTAAAGMPTCQLHAEDHVCPAEGRPQHGRGASLDHEVALPKQCRPTASTLGQAPGSVSAGSGVLQGECISGPGVLKRQVSGYLPLQGHKKLHLPTLGNAGATREAATVSTPHSWGQEARNRVFPTFSRWGRSLFGLRSRRVPSRQPSSAAGLCWARRAVHRTVLLLRTRYVISTQPPWIVRDSINSRPIRRSNGRKKGMPDPSRTG